MEYKYSSSLEPGSSENVKKLLFEEIQKVFKMQPLTRRPPPPRYPALRRHDLHCSAASRLALFLATATVMRKVEEELARAPPPSKAAAPEQELAKGAATVEQQLLLEP